jgi:serine protease AprX
MKHISLALVLICSCLGNLDVGRVGAQGLSLTAGKVSPELLEMRRGARVTVIVQLEEAPNAAFDSLLATQGGRITRRFRNFNAVTVELPVRAVEALAARNNVRFVSLDRENIPFGHVSQTTGADAVRATSGITTAAGFDGTGIGIAVLDSGIDTNHTAFLGRSSNNLRVIVSRDFTGEGRTDDPYGHGTHVASIAAGNARISNAQYTGIAPNANLINLRVLGAKGAGSVSAVLSALDWVMTNRLTYNIRVVNMSLGAPAIESYKNDPVCRAVRRLVDAGEQGRRFTDRYIAPATSLRRLRSGRPIPSGQTAAPTIRLPLIAHAARLAATRQTF